MTRNNPFGLDLNLVSHTVSGFLVYHPGRSIYRMATWDYPAQLSATGGLSMSMKFQMALGPCTARTIQRSSSGPDLKMRSFQLFCRQSDELSRDSLVGIYI